MVIVYTLDPVTQCFRHLLGSIAPALLLLPLQTPIVKRPITSLSHFSTGIDLKEYFKIHFYLPTIINFNLTQ